MNEYIKKWLNDRGISDNIIERAELDYDGNRIVIPVIDVDGNCQFSKFRRDPRKDSGAKYMYESGASATLYNAFMNRANMEVIITEGELDALALQSAGFSAVSSTGGSGTFKEEWVDFFEEKDVYILYDYDKAGIKGALEVQQNLPDAKIAWLPKENDATDYLLEYEPEDLQEVLDEAKRYPVNIDSVKGNLQAAELMIEERRELKEEALPAVARTKHTDIFQQHYLDKSDKIKKKNKLQEISTSSQGSLNVEMAKQVPIEHFIEIKPNGKGKCLWHEDENPSLHYYEDDNKVHCFVCSKQWDVIDVVQKKFDKDFKEAVRFILANQ